MDYSGVKDMVKFYDHGVNLIRILKEFNDAISNASIDADGDGDGGTPKAYNPKKRDLLYIIKTLQKWEKDQTLNSSGTNTHFQLILKSILPVDYVHSRGVKGQKYKQIHDLLLLAQNVATGKSQARQKELQKNLESEIKTMVELTLTVHKKIASSRAQWNSSRLDALHDEVENLHSTQKEAIEKIRDAATRKNVHIVFRCEGLGGEQLCAQSMARLIPPPHATSEEKFLNDNIIGLYCRCLDKQNKEAVEMGLLSKESTVVFWLTNLNVNKKVDRQQNEAKMNSWWNKRSGKKKMTDFESIYFPCVFKGHWTLYILNVSKNTVAHYCSMDGCAPDTSLLPRYDDLESFFSTVFEGEQIEYLVTGEQCPIQGDGFNCGVYVLILIHYHMNRFKLSSKIVPEFVNKFRYFILLCLYCQRHPEGSDEKTKEKTPIKEFKVGEKRTSGVSHGGSRGAKVLKAAIKQKKQHKSKSQQK